MNPQHETEQDEKDEKRLKELRKKKDDHVLNAAEKRELDELEEKEEHGKKHASGKNLKEPKETPEEKELREKREEDEARAKRWKDGKPTEDDIAFERISLLKEAHQILVDHVTRLGGVGAPMGPLGDRFMAWLKRYGDMAVIVPVETLEEKKAREEAENEGHPKIPKKETDRLDREEEEREKAEKEKEPKPFKFK